MKKKQFPKLNQDQIDFINTHYNQIVNTIKAMISKKYHMFYDVFCEKVDNISSFIPEALLNTKEERCKDLKSKILYIARKSHLLEIDSNRPYIRTSRKYIKNIVSIDKKLCVFDKNDYNEDVDNENFMTWVSKVIDDAMIDLGTNQKKKDLLKQIIIRSKLTQPNEHNYISIKDLCDNANVHAGYTGREVKTILQKIGQIIYHGENRQQYNGSGRDVKPDVAR